MLKFVMVSSGLWLVLVSEIIISFPVDFVPDLSMLRFRMFIGRFTAPEEIFFKGLRFFGVLLSGQLRSGLENQGRGALKGGVTIKSGRVMWTCSLEFLFKVLDTKEAAIVVDD